ncbi:MAG: hypothetical protein LBR54_03305 [Oscillospiraceae bacterium]|jgi:hypothetical protein|nr:hypothetical protein [Oscillospiraceae bacterium]
MVRLDLKRIDGNTVGSDSCVKFSFIKDYYTPYTLLSCVFIFDSVSELPVSEVMLYIDGKFVHHGLLDTMDCKRWGTHYQVTVKSRGFTSLLLQNNIEPVGIVENMSLDALMGTLSLPYVTHEYNSDANNYIFIEEKTIIWDAIINLAYKLTGGFPYIDGTNNVRITANPGPVSVLVSEKRVITQGFSHNNTKMMSRYYMQDPLSEQGYGFVCDNFDATLRNIKREKYLPLDRRFLYSPETALTFRTDRDMNGNFVRYCEYIGYCGEDLMDLLTVENYISELRITGIAVTGSAGTIRTAVSAIE